MPEKVWLVDWLIVSAFEPIVILPAPDNVFKVAPVVVALISTVAPLATLTDEELAIDPLFDKLNVPAFTLVDPV
jgi:hypothetical protein